MDDKRMKVVFKKQKSLHYFWMIILFLIMTSMLILLFSSRDFNRTFGRMFGKDGYWKDENTFIFYDSFYDRSGDDWIDKGGVEPYTEEQLEYLESIQPQIQKYLANPDRCAGREGTIVVEIVYGAFYCPEKGETTCPQAGITVYCPRGPYFQCVSPEQAIKCY